jgi:hypothetical protein
LFLFYTAANDQGVRSGTLYAKAKVLFADRKELFDPFWILTSYKGANDSRLVRDICRPLGVRYPKESAKSWYVNSRLLVGRYRGDHRNLLASTSDGPQLMRRIQAFRGRGLSKMDYSDYVGPVQRALLRACNSLHIAWSDVDTGLWIVGSQGCAKRRCRPCPIADLRIDAPPGTPRGCRATTSDARKGPSTIRKEHGMSPKLSRRVHLHFEGG